MFNYFGLNKIIFSLILLSMAGCVSANKGSTIETTFEDSSIKKINSRNSRLDEFVTSSVTTKTPKHSASKSAEFEKNKIKTAKITQTPHKELETQALSSATVDDEKSDDLVIKVVKEDTKDKKVNVSKPTTHSSKGFQLDEVYIRIVNAALIKESFEEEALLRGSEHALSAHKQDLLPQVRPGASVNSEGDTILQLNVEQVLYDSGYHKAGRKVLAGQKSAAEANYRIEQNDRATRAIASYIEYHRIGETQKLTEEILAIFKRYEVQSQQRISSGIGDNSESDLFQVKKLQAETDYETLESEKFGLAQEFKSITGIEIIEKKPTRLGLIKQFNNAPELALARAEQEEAVGNLELDNANQKPRISLNGNIGVATDSFDEENMDLRVEVSVNQPLNWGFNHAFAESQSKVDASNIKYNKAVRENRDKVKKLTLELRRAEGSLVRLKKLEKAARSRVKGFNSQFLAGKASINEAASIIDSFKQIKSNLTETKFRILTIELEIASISGLV